jgi:hypothetical protein
MGRNLWRYEMRISSEDIKTLIDRYGSKDNPVIRLVPISNRHGVIIRQSGTVGIYALNGKGKLFVNGKQLF